MDMDSYDAIREQLKSAQARAQETLRHRLESVIATLEDARAEVERATAGTADELFPLREVEAAVDELDVPQPEPTPPGVTLEVLRGLDEARSQSDLLNRLMTSLVDHASRAAVLVIRAQEVSAWSGVGFAGDTDLESWRGAVDASEAIRRLATEGTPIRFAPATDALLGEWLAGDETADEALLVPVSLRGKVMGAVYADSAGDGPWNPDMVQALVAVSCWLIDTLHHRSKAPAPMVAAPVEVVAGYEASTASAPEPELGWEPEMEEEPEAVAIQEEPVEEPEIAAASSEEMVVEPAAAEPEMEEEPEPGDEVEYPDELDFPEEPALPEDGTAPDAPQAEVAATAEIGDAEFDPSATVQVDLGEVEVSPPEEAGGIGLDTVSEETEGDAHPEDAWEPPPVAAEPPPVAAVEPPAVKPVTPPPDVTPADEEPASEGGPSLSPEEETRHEEARRFARLLVSEIKLYNERDVEQGRESGDLYRRLKEDIDRSREMYEKRIAPDVRAAHDYFHEELVRILADGNHDALGM